MDRKYRFKLLLCLLVALFISSCGGSAPVQDFPQHITPTATMIPSHDITVCASGCDHATLQEAIDASSTQPGMVISIEDPIHTEGDILLSKDVIIQGHGQDTTIIQAANSLDESTQRIFLIPDDVQAQIRYLTMRHGHPTTDELNSGGALRNHGDLILENVIIRDNHASAGGGILNDGTLAIRHSTITDNIAEGGGSNFAECKTGGGMKIMTGSVIMQNTTISSNQSKGKGGGVHIACLGELQASNSTISGNISMEDGGGLYINGMASLTHCTITENLGTNGGGIVFQGSGEHDVIRGRLEYQNTLIANNHTRLEQYGTADCLMGRNGEITINLHNWVADGNCGAEYSGEIVLLPLSMNGGFSPTHLLPEASPAIDLIPADVCPLDMDQRGVPRIGDCEPGSTESVP